MNKVTEDHVAELLDRTRGTIEFLNGSGTTDLREQLELVCARNLMLAIAFVLENNLDVDLNIKYCTINCEKRKHSIYLGDMTNREHSLNISGLIGLPDTTKGLVSNAEHPLLSILANMNCTSIDYHHIKSSSVQIGVI